MLKCKRNKELKQCNGCVSLYHVGDKMYRCGIFKRDALKGVYNPNQPDKGEVVYPNRAYCPFYSLGGNDYNEKN